MRPRVCRRGKMNRSKQGTFRNGRAHTQKKNQKWVMHCFSFQWYKFGCSTRNIIAQFEKLKKRIRLALQKTQNLKLPGGKKTEI